MEPTFPQSPILEYAAPADAVALAYVRDRVARLYRADGTGRAVPADAVRLSGRNAMRFVCWYHQQSYGALATGACNN